MEDELYRENILDHYKHPRNTGRLEDATFQARVLNPSCGDSIELFLKVTEGRVSEVKFEGRGCAVSQASISMLTERLQGRALDDALAIDEREVGPMRLKCALLSLHTLKTALASKN
jgi:nitrogen fixation NifU-like protein